MVHSTLTGYSILVVEQEPFMARCLRVLLEGAGAEVVSAASSAEALPLAEHDLSAAVLDYATSAKDGHRIPERLTARGIAFVFCKDTGVNEAWPHTPFLSKPVNGAQLRETLHALLQTVKRNTVGHKRPEAEAL